MSLQLNLERVRANAAASSTEDLLNRVTVYRSGMEPAALEIIEEELRRRGMSDEEIAARQRKEGLADEDGMVAKCSFCRRPAIRSGWGWQRLFRLVPVFPRVFRYCEEHAKNAE